MGPYGVCSHGPLGSVALWGLQPQPYGALWGLQTCPHGVCSPMAPYGVCSSMGSAATALWGLQPQPCGVCSHDPVGSVALWGPMGVCSPTGFRAARGLCPRRARVSRARSRVLRGRSAGGCEAPGVPPGPRRLFG